MKTTTNTKPTNTAPFDGSARQRLAHMGVLTAGGKPAGAVMPVFAGIFGGSFFDDFVALYQKPSELRSIYNIFADLLSKRAYDHMLVLLCIQYDFMYKPLPDPVLWLAGQPRALAAFMPLFMDRLANLLTTAGYLKPAAEQPERLI